MSIMYLLFAEWGYALAAAQNVTMELLPRRYQVLQEGYLLV